jgi:hypothetical protein
MLNKQVNALYLALSVLSLSSGWYENHQGLCLNCSRYYIGVLFFEQVNFPAQKGRICDEITKAWPGGRRLKEMFD